MERRDENGHWTGELSVSALSTAVALFALLLYARDGAARLPPAGAAGIRQIARAGTRWLAAHQNQDGGWGDTPTSRSNLSTTLLCWSALAPSEAEGEAEAQPGQRAAEWIRACAGSLEPEILAEAVAARYGKDRTFSVPILTMAALAGRLGDDGWRCVAPLPFELAACPRTWFRRLQLPVVSYALPALIAVGQAGHHHRPSPNPLLRGLRRAAVQPTLRVLSGIQPEGGGFLEAVPLTGFVAMSLIASGQGDSPTVRNCIEFLVRSVRTCGGWPIDTNLSTWLTTHAIQSLAEASSVESALPGTERLRIMRWLLAQQYRTEHPYTGAAPGGWAWTDLPGGVPDADDTAGALLALHHLAPRHDEASHAAAAGVRWLLDLQNRDGGMPTFCRGWGALPFDRSGADLTAHAVQAWTAWLPELPPALAGRTGRAIEHALRYLLHVQDRSGSFLPLWFGNEAAPEDENRVYGSARVLPALISAAGRPDVKAAAGRCAGWLLAVQNEDGGWGGGPGIASSIEETAVTVQALAAASRLYPDAGGAAVRGARRLLEMTGGGRLFPPAPIGLYFARLWYSEREYPVIFTAAALGAVRGMAARG